MQKKTVIVLAFFIAAVISFTCACQLYENLPVPTPIQAPATLTPQPNPVPTPSPSPMEPSQTPASESVIYDFFHDASVNDWTSFTVHWTDFEQLFYNDFFAYADNAVHLNGYFAIKNIDLLSTYEIPGIADMIRDEAPSLYDLPYEVWDKFEGRTALDDYGDLRLFIAKVDCDLENEFWDYRQGINYRVLTLVPENGQWKVMQDYQGYPGAAEYFGDAVAEEPEEPEDADAEETPNMLVDGTLHSTNSLTGYFLGTSVGDYLHVGIRTIEGEEMWFWVSKVCKTDPETLCRNQKIEVDWENRDVYIDEAEEVINLDRITDIRVLSE